MAIQHPCRLTLTSLWTQLRKASLWPFLVVFFNPHKVFMHLRQEPTYNGLFLDAMSLGYQHVFLTMQSVVLVHSNFLVTCRTELLWLHHTSVTFTRGAWLRGMPWSRSSLRHDDGRPDQPDSGLHIVDSNDQTVCVTIFLIIFLCLSSYLFVLYHLLHLSPRDAKIEHFVEAPFRVWFSIFNVNCKKRACKVCCLYFSKFSLSRKKSLIRSARCR